MKACFNGRHKSLKSVRFRFINFMQNHNVYLRVQDLDAVVPEFFLRGR